MILLGAGWSLLGFMNFLRFVWSDPPRSLRDIAADLFIILPLNLLFGAVIVITSILK